MISSARLFAATHTARCASAFTQGEAANAKSLAVRGGFGVGKQFLAVIAMKEEHDTLASQTIDKATTIVRDVRAIEVFLNLTIFIWLIPTQPPNGGVDAAARIKATFAASSKLRNTLPPLASNEFVMPRRKERIRHAGTMSSI